MRGLVALVGLSLGLTAPLVPAVSHERPPAALAAMPIAARRVYYQTVFERQAVQLYAKLGVAADGLPLSVFREGLVGY